MTEKKLIMRMNAILLLVKQVLNRTALGLTKV
jgi:hypothetical protein